MEKVYRIILTRPPARFRFPRACGLFLLRWLISAAPPCGCLHKSERGANSGSLYRPPGAVAVVAPWGSKPKPAASGAAARVCPATTPKRRQWRKQQGVVGAALQYLQGRKSRRKYWLSARDPAPPSRPSSCAELVFPARQMPLEKPERGANNSSLLLPLAAVAVVASRSVVAVPAGQTVRLP